MAAAAEQVPMAVPSALQRVEAEVRDAKAAVERAEAAVQGAEAEVPSAKAAVQGAEAEVPSAKAAVQRAEAALTHDRVSLLGYQSAQATLQSAHRRLQSAHRTLQSVYGTLQSAHGTLQSAHGTLQSAHGTLQSAIKRLNDLEASSSAVTGGLRGSGSGLKRSRSEEGDVTRLVERAILAKTHITSLAFDAEDLGDPAKQTELLLPVISAGEAAASDRGLTTGVVSRKFLFLGRVDFNHVLKFIRETPRWQIAYYTGLPGSGKSYLFAAAALQLFREFAASKSRVIYLQGAEYVENPVLKLRDALLLAYASEMQSSQMQIDFPSTADGLVRWVSERTEQLFFLIDEGEKFDRGTKTTDASAPESQRNAAYNLLRCCAESHSLVKCCSIRSEVYSRISSDKFYRHYLANPAFTDAELQQYLHVFRSDLHLNVLAPDGNTKLPEFDTKSPEVDTKPPKFDTESTEFMKLMALTGGVPRLVYLYGTEGFSQAVAALKLGVRTYIRKAEPYELQEFMGIVAGDTSPTTLPRAVLSRCFYSTGGKGACITDFLLQFTGVELVQHFELISRQEMDAALSIWTATMPVENNKSRLGHNAEIAAMLAVKFGTTIKVAGCDPIKVQPQSVQLISGTFSFHREVQGVLHVPSDFRQKGLDFYYSDDKIVVCFQVTVARDPVTSHPNTYSEFFKRTSGDPRLKYLIWVVHADDSSVHSTNSGITEVFCSFADLHSRLKVVDEVGLRIDGEKLKKKQKEEQETCEANVKKTQARCRKPPMANSTFCHCHAPKVLVT